MNDALNNQLAEALKGAQAAGKDVYAFLQQQAPDLVEQLIRWEIWSSAYGLAFGAVLLTVGVIWLWAKWDEDQMPLAFFPLILGTFVTGVNVYDLLKVLSAPKLVVLEYVSKMISS